MPKVIVMEIEYQSGTHKMVPIASRKVIRFSSQKRSLVRLVDRLACMEEIHEQIKAKHDSNSWLSKFFSSRKLHSIERKLSRLRGRLNHRAEFLLKTALRSQQDIGLHVRNDNGLDEFRPLGITDRLHLEEMLASDQRVLNANFIRWKVAIYDSQTRTHVCA